MIQLSKKNSHCKLFLPLIENDVIDVIEPRNKLSFAPKNFIKNNAEPDSEVDVSVSSKSVTCSLDDHVYLTHCHM